MAEKTTEGKSFDLRLTRASEAVRKQYQSILTAEQAQRARENNGKTVTIDITEKEQFLDRATAIVIYGKADPQKMAQDWESASRDGRPPIGGAQDN
ncbi:MAG: hypothetical protein UX13_C0027G0003 [Candidatus Woesebacteria bacterium GW2011_GWB1_45_5]|uniref:Uncharacterized protein n=1 Tax=Candidatus Woesebacteria bacterium GW2011_GWB1_45_5 TaxID=1618581 RepID=A0A0G1PWN4_9BACT|nr:MAG: hypothetical protein UX13_C0027G0003 [Candidatus Woesebacteria bacterium GW2011_GWB1_45_5]